ncbi:MAG: FAD-dependent oxidoreductase [Candidatus Krumholzibacteriota bacterium]|nr:FAD-dependent oxidoreductase [Candidatus Krumholzibacteriota bacterium]
MEKKDILVIGGSAAGLVAATTAKSIHPDRSVLVVRKDGKVLVPCGIPYVFGTVGSTEKNIMPADKAFDSAGIEQIVGEVLSIDREEKTVTIEGGTKIGYDKLVIATGSTPSVPGWLEGAGLENVFTVPKNKVYLDKAQETLNGHRKIVVIGGGFIGVEFSDELNKTGKEITLVEKLTTILALAFDEEIASRAQRLLVERGVRVVTGTGVTRILGEKAVTGVLLENGETLEADAVVLSVGYRPNTALAREAGLRVNEGGFICVDEYMRTDDRDVFAAGDCAEKRDFTTRKPVPVMLASTACAEARTAGMNLYGLSSVKTFSGTISIFSTGIGDTGFGAAGLTEDKAREAGFEIVTGVFEGMDKHPGSLPGAHTQMVKLVASRDSGVLLGGEVMGGVSAGEITNIIGFLIQGRTTLNSIMTAQIGTHPLLTASPAAYPLVKAAAAAVRKMLER